MPLLDPHILERQLDVRSPGTANGDQRALLARAELLAPRDRMLVRLSLANGVSRRQLAELMKLQPGSLTRRLQRLGARLNDPLVIALLRDDCPLAPEFRQLGVEHFLQGRHMRDLADAHHMTVNEVRRILTYLRGWHRGISGVK